MKNFFVSNIFSYLVLGPVEDNYLKLKEKLADLGVKPYQMVEPVDPEKGIVPIENVRQLRKKLRIKPLRAGEKIYLILRGRELGVATQNALLKIVEEPPRHLIIVILCQDKSELLYTLSSRCLIIRSVGQIDRQAHPESYPDLAKMNLQDLFNLSEKLAAQSDLEQIFDSWLLTKFSQNAMTKTSWRECEKILEAKKLLVKTNVNKRLLVDNLLIELQKAHRSNSKQKSVI